MDSSLKHRRVPKVCLALACTLALYLASSTSAQDQARHSFDSANLDRSCKPCDDFNEFASGGWLKSHPIPPEYPLWGSFITVIDENQKKLKSLLESAAQNTSASPGSTEQKIGDFYASCADTSA